MTATSLPLSADLRARTAAAHADAEGSPFFADLAAGRVTRLQVAALLGRLLPVYVALEQAARRWSRDPTVAPLVVRGMERSGRLRADLAALGATEAESPAGDAYAARIARVASTDRAAFVAHHYTRLLGDLSGGQVVRVALERSLGLEEDNGASFFAFPQVLPGPAKQAYRKALDALPLSRAERERLVEESLVAYRLNAALADELDALAG